MTASSAKSYAAQMRWGRRRAAHSVAAAVRFDYDRLDADSGMLARLARLKDSKDREPHQRAALLPVIMEAADMVAVVVTQPPDDATGRERRTCARSAARSVGRRATQ